MIHYRYLQQCLEQGLKLKKIHRILKFKQSDWMKPYIDFNTQKRTISNNEPDKNFFKLMNNAVYGKTMKNMRKRVKTNILVAIHEKKVCLTLNKPIYVGFTVLEISKWEMYSFHYNSMVKKFNTRLLFADTDSLCYEIYGKNPHKKIFKYRGLFDLSNFPKSSKYYCIDNKKVVGKMKDEYGGKLINKCIGLKSKMYSILGENDNEKSTNNGHNAFIEIRESHVILFQKKILRHKMRGIKSKNQNIGTYESNKISLSCYDDKSYILRNGIDTLAYRHKNISFQKGINIFNKISTFRNIYKKIFFFCNIRNHYLMDDKQYLENIGTLTENSMINKVNDFEQSVIKNNKFIDSYELDNLIIHRNLLIKTFEEIKKELKRDNRKFRIDFNNNTYNYFDKLSYNYFLKKDI